MAKRLAASGLISEFPEPSDLSDIGTMNWTEERDRSRVFYRSAAATDADLAEAFKELRRKLVTDVLPKHASSDWDALRVEIWPDSGRLIVYPGRAGSAARSEKAGCELAIQSLLDFWEVLRGSDIDDDAFAQRVRAEEKRIATLLLQTWTQDANDSAGADRRAVRVLFFDAEEPTPFLETSVPAFALR